ncbi:MAG: HlyC/CorC family transporter [Clostridia bacterium]|nr:HlyC/CorC family transporter [Clostridia bacterium]
MTWPVYVLALIVLVAFSAFFSGSEIAYSTVNPLRLKRIFNDTKNQKARRALYITDNYDRALSSILIGNNLVNLASSTIATQLFIMLLADRGIVGENTAAAISTAAITVFVLIFGETVPKLSAKGDPERFSMKVSRPLRGIMIIFSPIVWLVMKLIGSISKRWKTEEDDDAVTEDDLSEIIDTVEDEGVIDEDTSELLQSALDFPDICVYEIITPRVDMVAIDIEDSREEIMEVIETSVYSRIPVYEDSIDNIIGVLHLNQFLKAMAAGEEFDIRSKLLPVVFLHKTTILPQALRELREKKLHLAIVTDEYGGTMGLITMEDILEQLVGDIWDETDEIEDEIVELAPELYEVDGNMRIYDFLEEFEIDDRDFDDDNATVGGFAIEQLGGYPARGESFDFEHLTITVKQLQNLRVTRVLVKVNPKPEPEDDDEIDWEGKDKEKDEDEE